MRIFKNRTSKKRNMPQDNGVTPSNNVIQIERTAKRCLKDFVNDDHTYWRFSQSCPGRSEEKEHFAKYVEGEITIATDSEKKLSFVSNDNIGDCYMFGDVLTKICLNPENKKFSEIMNFPVEFIGGVWNEYQCEKLLVEKNYSLKNKDSIRLFMSFLSISDIRGLFQPFKGKNFEERLRGYDFHDSADLVSKIDAELEKNQNLTKKDILDFIDHYKNF